MRGLKRFIRFSNHNKRLFIGNSDSFIYLSVFFKEGFKWRLRIDNTYHHSKNF